MEADSILDALGDGTRRRIFAMLRNAALDVGTIAKRLPVSQPAVSQHLRVLREAGLVQAEKRGRQRIYRVRLEGFEPLRAFISAYWDPAIDAFAASFQPVGQEST